MRDELASGCNGNGLTAICDRQFANNVTEVKIYRTLGEAEFKSDVSAGKSMRRHVQTLSLSLA
jgi:hypothetical protein